MRPEHILLPLDIRNLHGEVFAVANVFAKRPGATVILLHVVTLNLAAPEKGVYEAVGREARWHLERLARRCLRAGVTTIARVRFGKPADEILAEAVDSNVDLIVMPSHPPSFWDRLFGPILPRVIQRVIREAPCGVFLTTATSRFDCERLWGRPGRESDAAPDIRDGAWESEPSPALLTETTLASTREPHRAVA